MTHFVNWVPKKNIDHALIDKYLAHSIATNHFTNGGPNVKFLEEFVKEKFGILDKSVICVCNGSSAIQMLCAGVEYVEGNVQWATQSFTFPSSAQSVLSKTLLVDIDSEGGMDVTKIPSTVTGIIVTNIFGNVVNIEKYENWAREKGKMLVFDNAATPFTFYKGKNACNYGCGSIISFHHTKPLGFGEGGAIITDKKYEVAIRRLINFGLDNECPDVLWHLHASNHKMSDISAVYILQYLDKMTDIVNHHKNMYNYIKESLSKFDFINLYPNFSDDTPFVSCFCLLFSVHNTRFQEILTENGIYCRKYYKPLSPTPEAMKIYDQIVCVPCTYDMDISDIKFIIDCCHQLSSLDK